jgi:hypothetical protein
MLSFLVHINPEPRPPFFDSAGKAPIRSERVASGYRLRFLLATVPAVRAHNGDLYPPYFQSLTDHSFSVVVQRESLLSPFVSSFCGPLPYATGGYTRIPTLS